MQDITNWIRTNKLPSALIAVLFVTVLILGSSKPVTFKSIAPQPEYSVQDSYIAPSMGVAQKSMPTTSSIYYEESTNANVAPQDRKVVGDSSLSVQVKNVNDSIEAIKSTTTSYGGFMVNSNVTTPMESASGYIVVRIPNAKIDEFLEFLRDSAIKVVSENINGTDVTDQYIDIEARLAVLNETKAKFEKLMQDAIKIEDILRVQNEIINLQYQIDAIKGAQKNLDQTSSSTRISVYLSTDEFSLPYSPNNNWRPDVVFKTAVRSLVLTFRGFADNLIWIGVYAVIWLPILAFVIFFYKKIKRPVNT